MALPQAAEARYAESGDGLYKGSIDWIEWGTRAGVPVQNGQTATSSRTIAGDTLTTSCRISEITATLNTYAAGGWRNDYLDNLYNVGGADGSNRLFNGLATANGGNPHFRIDCSATLGTRDVPLSGIVFADAETSGGHEYVQASPIARPDGPTPTWKIIDRGRATGCNYGVSSKFVTQNARSYMRLSPVNAAGAQAPNSDCSQPGPVAVGFLDGATGAYLSLKGGGISAIAVGVVLDADFGDAPTSYGQAGALFQRNWNGGVVPAPNGVTDVFKNFTLAVPGDSPDMLGDDIDSDSEYVGSVGANADDTTPLNGTNDEDSMSASIISAPFQVTRGQPFLRTATCTGDGTVAAWIDWDHNGAFQDDERSTPTSCINGVATLTWPAVPADTADSLGTDKTYLRVRIAAKDDASFADPSASGITLTGEVEDYAINVELPSLQIKKTSDFQSPVVAGDVVTYTITATNVGATPFTAEYPAIFADDLSGVLDDATYNDDATATPAKPGDEIIFDEASSLLTWAGPLEPQQSVELSYSVKLSSNPDGDLQMRNVAWFPGTNPPFDPPACQAPVNGNDAITKEPCAVVEFPKARSEWTIAKEAADEDGNPLASNAQLQPGDLISYTVTATSTSGDVAGVQLTDDLSEVLDNAALEGPIKLAVDCGTPASPDCDEAPAGTALSGTTLSTPEFFMPSKGVATLTYSVRLAEDAWNAEVANAVTGTGVDDPDQCVTGTSRNDLADACITSQVTPEINRQLRWNKVDQSQNALAGSEWELRPTAGGTALAIIDCTQDPCAAAGADTNPAPGELLVEHLAAGTYTLTETRAPVGFKLDGIEHAVSIAQNAELTTLDDIVNEQQAVPGLPLTGGVGSDWYVYGGGGALLLAVIGGVCYVLRRKRHEA